MVPPSTLLSPPRPALSYCPWLPGLALSAVLALAATFIASMHGGSRMLYALFLGMAFHYLSKEPQTRPGVEVCARTVLRLGVGLLGARITAEQIAGLGWSTALAVVLAVVSTVLCGWWLGRRLGLTAAQGVLSGGAVGICGASAALAISAVLPRSKDNERFTLMVVVTVTVLSTVAMVLYPLLVQWLALPPALAGLFLGGTIHDVAQVAGAGYMLNVATGDYAIIVKLLRVSLLALVVVVISVLFRSQRESAEQAGAGPRQALVPWFLWLFVVLVLLNSAGGVPALVQAGLSWVSGACLVTAIAALGMKTTFAELRCFGWRPLALLLTETLLLAVLVLGFIFWRGIP